VSSSRGVPTVREYRLDLSIDFEQLTFRGAIEADLVDVDGPVVLDTVELSIDAVSVAGRPLAFETRPEADELILRDVPAGTASVRVEYRGRANADGLMGLYRSRYGDGYILTTQCAPTDARRIFPCIDRPDRKAPMRLTLTIPDGLEAIFNTPIDSERLDGGRRVLRFTPTPPMSTYLFYLGVGKFDRYDGEAAPVRITVFTPKGRAEAGAFGAKHAAELLPEFGRYYGLPYPLPKLDLIAVPDFAYGAMENWGAISFREVQLLVDANTPTRLKRLALDTVAHEIAHQWFGNLVTMRWWDDIWLNESFATFLETRMVERLAPGYGSLENFLIYWMNRTLVADSLPTTHPITAEVRDASQISQVFDEISYGKGASVLRMIEAYLGEETFRRGIADYLSRFAHSNASSRDLWEALDRAAGVPVHPMLEEWLNRPGLPLLSVRGVPGGLEVTQRRYALDGHHTDERWPIPMIAEINGTVRKLRLNDASMRIPVERLQSLHFNPGAVGFYRVLYDDPTYALVRREYPTRSSVDQWVLVQDLYAFQFSGEVAPARYAELVEASAPLTAYLPVREITEQLLALRFSVGEHPAISPTARSFLRAQCERLGPTRRPGETETDGVLRERAASARLWYDPEFARELASHFSEMKRVDPDLRPSVALAYGRTGGAEAHAALRRASEAATTEGEAQEFETGLASSADPALIEATYRLMDEGILYRAHLPQIVRSASQNPEGREATWAWMQRRLEAVGRESRGTGFSSYVYEFALPYVGLTRKAELEEWVRTHTVLEGERGARKGFGLLGAIESLRRRYAALTPSP
jgi:tricorn protease interacting factor F2/3